MTMKQTEITKRYTKFGTVRSYFKTCGVVFADRIVNDIYGMGSEKLRQSAEEAKKENPKLSKAVDIATKWGFWIGVAQIGSIISKYVGNVAGYTLAFSHPILITLAKHVKNIKKAVDEISEPSIRSYSTTFAILEIASTPVAIWAMESIAKLSNGLVSAGMGALSAIGMTISGLVVEYAGFRFIWRNIVLKSMGKGGLADDLKGFSKEFRLFGITTKRKLSETPKTAGEYVGQLWGIIETNWMWVQITRTLVAGLVAGIYTVKPSEFVSEYFKKSAEWGKGYFDSVVSVKNRVDIQKKIEENKKNEERNPENLSRSPSP